MADNKPTSKFKIPINTVFKDLDGNPMDEPDGIDKREFALDANGVSRPVGPDIRPRRDITLGLILTTSLGYQDKIDGVTLTVLDRLELQRKFKGKTPPEIKISTCEQVKLLVKAAFGHVPILGGQALELLGEEPGEL